MLPPQLPFLVHSHVSLLEHIEHDFGESQALGLEWMHTCLVHGDLALDILYLTSPILWDAGNF